MQKAVKVSNSVEACSAAAHGATAERPPEIQELQEASHSVERCRRAARPIPFSP